LETWGDGRPDVRTINKSGLKVAVRQGFEPAWLGLLSW